jgi:hypothetical protein
MAVIDLEGLDVEVMELSAEDLHRQLDMLARDLLGITGDEFLSAIREGQEIDNPAAVRLAVLARALIDRQ